MPEKEVGKITHWYDKIGVAVIKLSGSLKVGDQIKVLRGEDEFEVTVESMQVEHQPVSSAKKGEEIAVKLPQKAKQGATILLIS